MSAMREPQAVVLYLLRKKGMTKDEIARGAGVSKRMVDYTVTGGPKQMGSKALDALAASLNLTRLQLVTAAMAEQSNLPAFDEIVFVRKMHARPRGGDGGHETEPGYSLRYAFQKEWIERKGSPGSMRLFDVVGNSMAPTITDGSMVLVDEARRDWVPGKIYLITLNDAFMIKRASMKPGLFVLQSDNPDKVAHPDIEVSVDSPDYFMVHGCVLWACREF